MTAIQIDFEAIIGAHGGIDEVARGRRTIDIAGDVGEEQPELCLRASGARSVARSSDRNTSWEWMIQSVRGVCAR